MEVTANNLPLKKSLAPEVAPAFLISFRMIAHLWRIVKTVEWEKFVG